MTFCLDNSKYIILMVLVLLQGITVTSIPSKGKVKAQKEWLASYNVQPMLWNKRSCPKLNAIWHSRDCVWSLVYCCVGRDPMTVWSPLWCCGILTVQKNQPCGLMMSSFELCCEWSEKSTLACWCNCIRPSPSVDGSLSMTIQQLALTNCKSIVTNTAHNLSFAMHAYL